MKSLALTLLLAITPLSWAKETTALEQGFSQWIAEEFEDETGPISMRAHDADPDHDGLSNLMEYALDTDPLYPSNRLPIKYASDSNKLTVSYPADKSKSDIRYQVETSSNLRSWQPIDSETLTAKGSIEIRQASMTMNQTPCFLRLTVRFANLD